MINSIVIKNIASYDDDGIELNDLKKINFIYGANGCGKTTITNYLYQSDDIAYEKCSVKMRNDAVIKRLIYNKTFREKNFGKGNIDGVFTLGHATAEQIKIIENKRIELNKLKEKGLAKAETIVKQQNEKDTLVSIFKEEVWTTIYKKNENNFKEAFKGVMLKDSFKNKLVSEFNSNKYELLTFDDLVEKAQTIFGEVPQLIPLITNALYDRILVIQKEKIWAKKIIGKIDVNIGQLIQKLNLNDWVNEGRKHLQENETCPFCQQPTITTNFRKQLEDYFDKSFTDDVELIKNYTDEYNRLALNAINVLSHIENTEKNNSNTKLNLDTFSAYLKTLETQFISNKELLNNKSKEPSRSIQLISVIDQIQNIKLLIEEANKQIRKHNEIVNNYTKERSNLISAIWKFLIEENKAKIQVFINKANGLDKGINALNEDKDQIRIDYTKLNKEIKELSKNVTDTQHSIDEINRTLISYGFTNFSIVKSTISKNQYQIQREDGSIADSTLSEGEVTFITFLYFLQLAKGGITEDSITEERILIVDDPICSLDSNVLFLISTLLKEIIKDIKNDVGSIKQLIVLTHNIYFHKEASFIDGRNKINADTYFWILRKLKNKTSIQCYKMENPIKNSYELLWQELKEKDKNSGITIQNTMRRIIENYFKILGKYGDEELIKKFKIKEDQEICRSLLSWINDGSHCLTDDLFIEHQGEIIEKYFEVFKNIFIHTNHEEHYKMMMGEIDQAISAI